MVNLGKEPGTKAYRLFDPKNNKLYVSRDVAFEEERAWNCENLGETEAVHIHDLNIPDGATKEDHDADSPRSDLSMQLMIQQR